MGKINFELMQKSFDKLLDGEQIDFEQLDQLFLKFQQQLFEQEGHLDEVDLLVYQSWFETMLPRLEKMKSTMAEQLAQLKQGKKALNLYGKVE